MALICSASLRVGPFCFLRVDQHHVAHPQPPFRIFTRRGSTRYIAGKLGSAFTSRIWFVWRAVCAAAASSH